MRNLLNRIFCFAPTYAILWGFIIVIVVITCEKNHGTIVKNRTKIKWEQITINSSNKERIYNLYGYDSKKAKTQKDDSISVFCLDIETMYYLTKDTIFHGKVDSIIITNTKIIIK